MNTNRRFNFPSATPRHEYTASVRGSTDKVHVSLGQRGGVFRAYVTWHAGVMVDELGQRGSSPVKAFCKLRSYTNRLWPVAVNAAMRRAVRELLADREGRG